jgi:hypothetical protein
MYDLELHNYIYKFILAREETRDFTLRHVHPGASQDSESTLKDRHPSRQYLGLAQTNQLLRTEFLSLYMKAWRPAIDIAELAEYLDVFPMPDSALTHSIHTVLDVLRRMKTAETVKAPGIDILPFLRADWNSFPFVVIDQVACTRATHLVLHWLLNESSRNRAVFDELCKSGISAVYLHRRSDVVSIDPVDAVVTLRMCAAMNATASKEKLRRIFDGFIKCTGILLSYRVAVECDCGGYKMVARRRRSAVIRDMNVAAGYVDTPEYTCP